MRHDEASVSERSHRHVTFEGQLLDELDHDRVYDSDLKKLFQWYNILHANGAFLKEESKEEEEGKEEVESKGE